MENKILDILTSSKDYVSGEYLSEILNVSRTSIWKHIKNLKNKGYKIEGISNRGYKLTFCPDRINKDKLKSFFKTKKLGNNIFLFDELDSTNKKAKDIAKAEGNDGSILIAEKQTLGSGRFNRSWNSPSGGLWFSIILKPNISPDKAPKITQIAGAAIHKCLKDFNIDSEIKWPNDILLNNKKICGILAEMKCDMDRVHYLILGIGLNVNIELPSLDDSIKDTATSLKIEFNKSFDRNEILAHFLNNFELLYNKYIETSDMSEVINICKENSKIWGKKSRLINFDQEEIVTCVSLTDSGDLIVKDSSGKLKSVLSGEISFKSVD